MHRIALLVASLFLAPAAAHAAGPHFTTADLCQVLQPCQPPAQFQSGPFLAEPVIRAVSMAQVQTVCGRGYAALPGEGARHAVQGGGFGIMGCAQLRDGACVVHVPADLKGKLPALYELVLAHELGHCRGWVHRRY
jgi:hypothetical protein